MVPAQINAQLNLELIVYKKTPHFPRCHYSCGNRGGQSWGIVTGASGWRDSELSSRSRGLPVGTWWGVVFRWGCGDFLSSHLR